MLRWCKKHNIAVEKCNYGFDTLGLDYTMWILTKGVVTWREINNLGFVFYTSKMRLVSELERLKSCKEQLDPLLILEWFQNFLCLKPLEGHILKLIKKYSAKLKEYKDNNQELTFTERRAIWKELAQKHGFKRNKAREAKIFANRKWQYLIVFCDVDDKNYLTNFFDKEMLSPAPTNLQVIWVDLIFDKDQIIDKKRKQKRLSKHTFGTVITNDTADESDLDESGLNFPPKTSNNNDYAIEEDENLNQEIVQQLSDPQAEYKKWKMPQSISCIQLWQHTMAVMATSNDGNIEALKSMYDSIMKSDTPAINNNATTTVTTTMDTKTNNDSMADSDSPTINSNEDFASNSLNTSINPNYHKLKDNNHSRISSTVRRGRGRGQHRGNSRGAGSAMMLGNTISHSVSATQGRGALNISASSHRGSSTRSVRVTNRRSRFRNRMANFQQKLKRQAALAQARKIRQARKETWYKKNNIGNVAPREQLEINKMWLNDDVSESKIDDSFREHWQEVTNYCQDKLMKEVTIQLAEWFNTNKISLIESTSPSSMPTDPYNTNNKWYIGDRWTNGALNEKELLYYMISDTNVNNNKNLVRYMVPFALDNDEESDNNNNNNNNSSKEYFWQEELNAISKSEFQKGKRFHSRLAMGNNWRAAGEWVVVRANGEVPCVALEIDHANNCGVAWCNANTPVYCNEKLTKSFICMYAYNSNVIIPTNNAAKYNGYAAVNHELWLNDELYDVQEEETYVLVGRELTRSEETYLVKIKNSDGTVYPLTRDYIFNSCQFSVRDNAKTVSLNFPDGRNLAGSAMIDMYDCAPTYLKLLEKYLYHKHVEAELGRTRKKHVKKIISKYLNEEDEFNDIVFDKAPTVWFYQFYNQSSVEIRKYNDKIRKMIEQRKDNTSNTGNSNLTTNVKNRDGNDEASTIQDNISDEDTEMDRQETRNQNKEKTKDNQEKSTEKTKENTEKSKEKARNEDNLDEKFEFDYQTRIDMVKVIQQQE